ncbi:hypothetical protein [Serratia nevei]|uniref:hypothetical protein n=1 Tax=Serratia nevei TaxID=2703794 RepID=UPI003315BF52
MPYTIDDYKLAQDELERVNAKWDRYSGNNPNKYRSEISAAKSRVRAIENSLKSQGVMPLSEKEILERELNREFPNARSKQIVEFHGKQYIKKFFPLERSRSGKSVTEWGSCWELV